MNDKYSSIFTYFICEKKFNVSRNIYVQELRLP